MAVIVPAYQEARLISRTLDRVPAYVDRIYVVDDGSRDGTGALVEARAETRVVLLRHLRNRGVGAAIATGYARALRDGCDALVVMAGDDQMHPDDLSHLLEAVTLDGFDYAKGNRLMHETAARMPRARRLGSRLLSGLTRLATGYPIGDAQCGFTVLRREVASSLPLGRLWPRYGYPNDLLSLLGAAGASVVDVPVRAVYADESSGLRPHHLLTIAGVIALGPIRRRWERASVLPTGLRSFAPKS